MSRYVDFAMDPQRMTVGSTSVEELKCIVRNRNPFQLNDTEIFIAPEGTTPHCLDFALPKTPQQKGPTLLLRVGPIPGGGKRLVGPVKPYVDDWCCEVTRAGSSPPHHVNQAVKGTFSFRNANNSGGDTRYARVTVKVQ